MALKRILVIDDADDVRRLVQRQLQSLGYETIGASNGEEGLAAVDASKPDLVLCDLRMPRVDGLTVLRTLHGRRPDLPVVVLSGEGVFNDAIEALRAGAWDYITKPLGGMAVLDHAVKKALEKARLIEENQRQRTRLETLYRELAEDHAAGRKLQQGLLPANGTKLGSFTLSRELVPSMYLSGDFVDAFALDGARWGFFLADVAGHGVSSALVTVMLHTLVDRRLLETKTLTPAALLAELNQALLAQGHEKHVAFFFGLVDEAQQTLTCANAGCFPWPVLVNRGVAQALELPGMPLGLMPNAQYEERTFPLTADARIVACTDGVFEVLPEQTQAQRLSHVARLAERCLTAREFVDALKLPTETSAPDDIAVMMLSRGE